ncbi:hypothetical protein C0Q70_18550 [Pomacea canaliculata]|uniref:Uncharacterized protein n=1 Tax=Pomacea canaliculata TaxID=400727 RepID=A0A2T7NGW5_POMCA|nr:hypothetical protein C0Q70_18550 [Pomacea canaliculata]
MHGCSPLMAEGLVFMPAMKVFTHGCVSCSQDDGVRGFLDRHACLSLALGQLKARLPAKSHILLQNKLQRECTHVRHQAGGRMDVTITERVAERLDERYLNGKARRFDTRVAQCTSLTWPSEYRTGKGEEPRKEEDVVIALR